MGIRNFEGKITNYWIPYSYNLRMNGKQEYFILDARSSLAAYDLVFFFFFFCFFPLGSFFHHQISFYNFNNMAGQTSARLLPFILEDSSFPYIPWFEIYLHIF